MYRTICASLLRQFALVSCSAVFVAVSPARAAEPPSAETFAKHSEVTEVSLSPTGEYVAIATPRAGGTETQLDIVKIDGGQTQVLSFGKRNHITDVIWTADDRVTVARAEMEPLKAQPYSLGELFSARIDGKKQEVLFAYVPNVGTTRGRRKDEGYASVVKVLDKEPGKILVSFTCWNCGDEPDAVIFKVDTVTGERQEVERAGRPARFMFDQDGKARFMVTKDQNDEPVLSYRKTRDAAWAPLPKTLAGYSLAFARFADDGNTVYALISDARGPDQLYRLDLAAGARQKLAGREDVEIAYLLYAGRNGPPFAAVYDAAKPMIEYLEGAPEWASLHQDLMGQFPGELVYFLESSRDNSKLLFVARSDRHPGAYYIFDRDKRKMTLVAESQPWIQPAQMARTKAISFKSRDGKLLFGFYTSLGGDAQPLVVMPHGGPHGPYDEWGYDPDVQYLATHGYAVLQVNYRGSGGRGQAFLESGYREWGGKIQDDIADGVRWAIENKLADPSRICTYGSSFGGYAALMQPIRYPELYKCAIGYVGVYDLNVMHKAGDIPDTRTGRRYLERAIGSDTSVLNANSPARNVDKIKVPVFLAQGNIDRRVPMDQFNALKKAFSKAAGMETMVVAGEGHGFYAPENQAEMYRRMKTFLDKHIGAATK
ncbi:dipeptidyl aminopeptidase/acylaminoacyl peptidase [Luteimonas cucumeris]|uniref:Dipeptidyl aminopeptidase/acylaminoacyl peptidase n=1 Tax=Luteimonas cucumeris TaxID=985012 RepID=A0A562L093_9GAMM|nr:prolyl oligopeptidase family serine peptidase [Luteimonas cucumeris]TWI01055.1 dipeptidyl aminopeptidase/acylaminoacyl peptidase [Luteimonas cucumeris]